ncbi:peptidoglycan DD-metalloendopeptidase family protein [uncultured Odoribacter sp.]|uniref:M23 family metallopeptidase n=1 Tax=uncultured Odoribacter sp. TaxID=876416 RepID=UPI002620ACBB|nr:peptidoglycan DD-metalloendopeptidase family protein [uncultured Odoribacter sp.]
MTKKKQVIFSSLLGVVLLVIIFMPKREVVIESLDEVDVTDSTEVQEIVYKYGIPVNDYDVDYGVVKRNQSLSTILGTHGLSSRQIHDLGQCAKGIFDVRKIKGGQAYAFFSRKDSLATPEYFVYEADPRSYVVFRLKEDYEVAVGKYPVEWKRKEVKGTVQSSLWNAMVSCSTDPLLAVELSRIFGWSIDFFGLQRKDEFRVIYEQECVEGQELANFNIVGAVFRHADSSYYAIPFLQNGEILFFNEHGKSLEGAFLKAPLDYFRISSRFSNSRFHPVLKKYRAHHGVDYAAPVGTPVYAIGAGTVIAKGYQANGGGNYLKIKHNGTYTTTYMHLSRFEKGIKVGSKVAQKEVIGYVGSTGLATGPHLDFRVFENGRPVNPLTIKSQPKEPVKPENLAQFNVLRDSIMEQLSRL